MVQVCGFGCIPAFGVGLFGVASSTLYAKAYLVYSDKNGNTQTVYGNLITVNA